MASQHNSKSLLPRWIIGIIIGIFLSHFALLTVHHLSAEILPKRLWYITARYVRPWFIQNFMVFAPEPLNVRHVLLYRIYVQNEWSRWQYPAYSLLQDEWACRIHPSSKKLDQLERLGYYFVQTSNYFETQHLDPDNGWRATPTLIAAKSYIEQANQSLAIDSFQVSILLESRSIVDDSLAVNDSLLMLPKYEWFE